MSNNIDGAFDAYNKAKERFFTEHDAYIKLCKDKGNNIVVLSQDAGAYIALKETISWAVVLYDRTNNVKFTKQEIRFMSGIKFIDNTIKHTKVVFDIYAILRPGTNITLDVEDNKEGPKLNGVEIEPCLVWGKLDNIPIEKEYENQRHNYFTYVNKLGVVECINKMDAIIRNKCMS